MNQLSSHTHMKTFFVKICLIFYISENSRLFNTVVEFYGEQLNIDF